MHVPGLTVVVVFIGAHGSPYPHCVLRVVRPHNSSAVGGTPVSPGFGHRHPFSAVGSDGSTGGQVANRRYHPVTPSPHRHVPLHGASSAPPLPA